MLTEKDMTNIDELMQAAIAESWHRAISRSEVLLAISSDDLEVAGIAYDLLSEDRKRRWIDPPLSPEEVQSITMDYLERCINQNPTGEWCLSRYESAWEVQRWILNLWDSEVGGPGPLERWKQWIEKLYQGGDERIRRALVDGILEHLFEHRALQEYFADWKTRSEFQRPYDEAKLWADNQG